MKVVKIDKLNDLPQAAYAIIEELTNYKIVAFHGSMGAGKTTLIREIANQMGVEDQVTSPTFALVNQYKSGEGEVIYHFDFYRINKIEEAFDLGYEEYFFSGDLCLVEWPEKIAELMPEDILVVKIDIIDDEAREITIGAREEFND